MRVNVLSNTTLGLSSDPGWGGEAPLWFYILREAELPPSNTERLGQVGDRIVAEVRVGRLQRDPNSYLYLDPAWKPAPPIAPATGQFTFADLLRYAGGPDRRSQQSRAVHRLAPAIRAPSTAGGEAVTLCSSSSRSRGLRRG
jgi:hypothetical protein